MKVLITGNMGYIGPVATEYFKSAAPDFKLMGFDTGYFATCLLDDTSLPELRLFAQYFGDVRKFPAEILRGIDAVIYLSAISNDPMGNAFEKVTGEINADCAVSVASVAKAAGVKRFVFASSCSMYGFAEGGARKETDALNPLTAYARSKVAGEEGLKKLADENFLVTCLRFATACGASPRIRLDLVLNDFVASALTTGKIEILSDGTPWRPLIHVRDMARAMHWALMRTMEQGGAFLAVNAGSNTWNYQVKDLAEAVARHLPGTTVHINPNATPDKRSYQVSFDLFAQLAPQYIPQVTLDDAIDDLISGLKRANFAEKNFRESKFIRLNVLNKLKAAQHLDNDLYWKT